MPCLGSRGQEGSERRLGSDLLPTGVHAKSLWASQWSVEGKGLEGKIKTDLNSQMAQNFITLADESGAEAGKSLCLASSTQTQSVIKDPCYPKDGKTPGSLSQAQRLIIPMSRTGVQHSGHW